MNANGRSGAFPVHQQVTDGGHVLLWAEQGLTKREMFAAMAMQGLLSGVDEPNVFGCAKYAVLLADALLAELEKPAESEASR